MHLDPSFVAEVDVEQVHLAISPHNHTIVIDDNMRVILFLHDFLAPRLLDRDVFVLLEATKAEPAPVILG